MLVRRTISSLLLLLAASIWTPRLTGAQTTPVENLPPSKSEAHALKLSLLGTGLPIAAGAVVLALGVSHRTYIDPYSGQTFEYDHRWGTGVGVAAMGAGVMLGPTLGYLYVGKVGGLPIRLLLPAAGVAAGLIPAATCQGEDCAINALAIGFAAGCALAVVDAGYDIGRLKRVVRSGNERTRHAGVHVVPSYLKSTGQPAVALRVGF